MECTDGAVEECHHQAEEQSTALTGMADPIPAQDLYHDGVPGGPSI
jgi:hypothetical protein